MEKDKFELQIRAIRYSIKELKKEYAKAFELKNDEWLEETETMIKSLEEAVKTVQAMRALSQTLIAL